MLEETWEHATLHEGLAQYHLQNFGSKTTYISSGLVKKLSWGAAKLVFVCHKCYRSLASFPGPAHLSIACSTEKQGEIGIFSHMAIT